MALDPIEIAEEFFEAVRKVRALGAGTPETAYYPALSTLLERIGASLSPKVLPLSQLANTGAGSPDFGLFAASQLQKGEPRKGQLPERGVIEVKGVDDASLFTSTPTQLSKYFDAYRLPECGAGTAERRGVVHSVIRARCSGPRGNGGRVTRAQDCADSA